LEVEFDLCLGQVGLQTIGLEANVRDLAVDRALRCRAISPAGRRLLRQCKATPKHLDILQSLRDLVGRRLTNVDRDPGLIPAGVDKLRAARHGDGCGDSQPVAVAIARDERLAMLVASDEPHGTFAQVGHELCSELLGHELQQRGPASGLEFYPTGARLELERRSVHHPVVPGAQLQAGPGRLTLPSSVF
jgi:hypothetical protein